MDSEIKVIKGAEEREKGYFDFSLLFLTLILIAFGVIMIYSASSYNATKYYSDPMFFARSQIKHAVLGIVAMLLITAFPYTWLKWNHNMICWLAYIAAVGLTFAVALAGRSSNGSTRWLELFNLSVQPSEVCKLVAIVFVAFAISEAPKRLENWKGPLKIFIYMSLIIVFVAIENLSSAIIIAVIVGATCFIASEKKLYYLGYLGLGIAFVAVFIAKAGYRSERIDIWLNIETHEKGGQILQGLYAIASAGMFGCGLGNSMQKMGHIPEAHNDMIFSIICEELGIVGVMVLIFFYVLLLWRIYVVAVNAGDLFGSMLCVGVLINIALQLIMNIAVVTNTIPSTGVALPFISYGGSSLLVFCAEIGLVLNVSARIRYERVEG